MGRRKRLKKAILGLEKQILKHEQKIQEYRGPKKILIDYWEGEIERMKKVRDKKQNKL